MPNHTVTLNLSPALYQALLRCAEQQNKTLKDTVDDALLAYLKHSHVRLDTIIKPEASMQLDFVGAWEGSEIYADDLSLRQLGHALEVYDTEAYMSEAFQTENESE